MELIMNRFKTTSNEEFRLQMARHRVQKIGNFFSHLFIFTIGVLIYVAKTYFGAPLNFWPIQYINCAFMCVWTFVIAVQGIRLFCREIIFGTNWENRKIQEYLNNKNQTKWK